MKIVLEVEKARVEYTRNWFTGSAVLTVDGQRVVLQSSLNPGTHFSVALKKAWQCNVKGQTLTIETERPLLFAGFRPHTYRIMVNGQVVAQRHGF
jgi:hypothetical protein